VIFDGKGSFTGRFTILFVVVDGKGMIFVRVLGLSCLNLFVSCVYGVVCSLRCALIKEGLTTCVLLNNKWF